jgi:N-acetylneuraminic acid mutarotase
VPGFFQAVLKPSGRFCPLIFLLCLLKNCYDIIFLKRRKIMLFIQKIKYVPLIGILAILGVLGITSISFAQSNPWKTKANMLTERFGLSACEVNGKIYVIGGAANSSNSPISTVEEYNPATDTWTIKSSQMPTPRAWFAACVVNGKIYTIGGAQNVMGAGFSTVEVYDPVADTWTSKTDMPTARFVFAASVVNGKIYAIGGKPRHGAAPLTIVEEYNPEADTWTSKSSMEMARFGLTAGTVNDKIYAIGGSSSLNAPFWTLPTVEEYDPATDTWVTKANIQAARGYFASSVVNSRVYVVGGGKNLDTSILSTVEEYNPIVDTWSPKTDMPTARFSLSTCTVNDKIYAIGGAVTDWSTYQYWQGCSTVEEYDPSSDPTTVIDPSWR